MKNIKQRILTIVISGSLLILNVALSKAADFSITAGNGELQYHMKEVNSSGGLLNKEVGTLPSKQISAEAKLEDKSIEWEQWQSTGLVQYIGMTQVGFPLLTYSKLDIQGTRLLVKKSWILNEASSYALGLGISNTQVDRNILPSAGSLPLREKLDSTQAVISASAQLPLVMLMQRPLNFSAEINLLPALRNRLAVDSFGLYDVIVLEPSRKVDWSAKLKLQYPVTPWFGIWLAAQSQTLTPSSTGYQTWNKGGVPSALVRYPGSLQFFNQIIVGGSLCF